MKPHKCGPDGCDECGHTKAMTNQPKPERCPECNEPFDEHEHDAHGFKGSCKPSPEPPAEGGLDSIMGKWPGNETDKQIAEALGEELEPLDEWEKRERVDAKANGIDFVAVPVTAVRDRIAAEKELLEERLRINRKIIRYIAFVLTGDESADAQLAADRIAAERAAAERGAMERANRIALKAQSIAVRQAQAEVLREVADELCDDCKLRGPVVWDHGEWSHPTMDGVHTTQCGAGLVHDLAKRMGVKL